MSACPVCGHVDGACKGKSADIITVSGVVKRTGPERVPRQRRGIGKAGYVGEGTGKVEIYDPDVPHLRLVQPEDTGTGDGGDASELGLPAVSYDASTSPSFSGGFTAEAAEEPDSIVPPVDVTSKNTIDKPKRTRRKKADDE